MDGSRRLEVLSRQMCAAGLQPATLQGINDLAAVCPVQLENVLLHDNRELRAAVFDFLKDDIFKPNQYLSLLEFRELTLQRLKKFVAAKFPDGRGFDVRDYLNSKCAKQSSGFNQFSLGN
eukprot:gene9658-9818_t